MDARGFERLSKQVAAAPDRRRMLGALGVGLGAAVLGRRVAAAETVEDERFGLCALPGSSCKDNHKCCSGKCRNGVCTCVKRGKYALLGIICCSGKRKKGKCK